jgi:hypothetical protein
MMLEKKLIALAHIEKELDKVALKKEETLKKKEEYKLNKEDL